MPTLGLIACCKAKSVFRQQAETLYSSPLFMKSLAVAKQQTDAQAILSAKYGLVALDDVIRPYDETLNDMSAKERAIWAASAAREIREAYPKHRLIYYTGEIYSEGLPPGEHPMQGMPIGKRLQWLTKQLEPRGLI